MVLPNLPSAESNITGISDILSNASTATAEIENQENEPPLQASNQWYQGVTVKPVSFKAINRRPSQNSKDI